MKWIIAAIILFATFVERAGFIRAVLLVIFTIGIIKLIIELNRYIDNRMDKIFKRAHEDIMEGKEPFTDSPFMYWWYKKTSTQLDEDINNIQRELEEEKMKKKYKYKKY